VRLAAKVALPAKGRRNRVEPLQRYEADQILKGISVRLTAEIALPPKRTGNSTVPTS